MNRSLAVIFSTLLALGAAPLALAGGTVPAAPQAAAAPAATPSQETRDIRKDKKSIHETRRQRRHATRQLDRDKLAGNAAGAKVERQAVKGDTKTIRQDKRAMHGARKTRRQAKTGNGGGR